MTGLTEVAIVGAGPYGLSIAAHLAAGGGDFVIFGSPMDSWRARMPAGMHLKSDGFASNIYDPAGRLTLQEFCSQRGLPYDHCRLPVALDTFVEYGLTFQATFVSRLEDRQVLRIGAARGAFELSLDDGRSLRARQVVLATGITHFAHVPPALESLGPALCSHSSIHRDLGQFAGHNVVVLGGGASATDVAVLLHEAGASVELVSRRPLEFHQPPGAGPRPLWQRMRRPHLGLGPSMRSAIYTAFPGQFRLLPQSTRLRIVRRHLGPAGGWFVRDSFTRGDIAAHEGFSLREARAEDGAAVLRFARADGTALERRADHVIAATGYKVSLPRLAFLDGALREQVRVAEGYPVLSRHFESSVPGLYFVGLPAAGSFGPLMRFALGAGYTSRRLAAHLSAAAARAGNMPAGHVVSS